MCNSRCNCSSGCGSASSCGRNGERILVNQAGCGSVNRNRCSCANTYRPGCGCGNQGNNCHRPCPPRPCPPKPCPPRPCPPRPCPPRPCPRPNCEDRCRAQYRQCMRNCRLREENVNRERFYEDEYDCDNHNDYREDFHDDYSYDEGCED